jgi:hypothetical protein
MTINSISTFPLQTPQAIDSTARNNADSNVPPTTQPQGDTPEISWVAHFLSNLQQTQQADPALYQQVTSFVVGRLQDGANYEAKHGNTAFSDTLSQLATQFQNGQIPSVETLQQDGLLNHANPRERSAWVQENQSMLAALGGGASPEPGTVMVTPPPVTNQ